MAMNLYSAVQLACKEINVLGKTNVSGIVECLQRIPVTELREHKAWKFGLNQDGQWVPLEANVENKTQVTCVEISIHIETLFASYTESGLQGYNALVEVAYDQDHDKQVPCVEVAYASLGKNERGQVYNDTAMCVKRIDAHGQVTIKVPFTN